MGLSHSRTPNRKRIISHPMANFKPHPFGLIPIEQIRTTDLFPTLKSHRYGDLFFEESEDASFLLRNGHLAPPVYGRRSGVGILLEKKSHVVFGHTNDLTPLGIQQLINNLNNQPESHLKSKSQIFSFTSKNANVSIRAVNQVLRQTEAGIHDQCKTPTQREIRLKIKTRKSFFINLLGEKSYSETTLCTLSASVLLASAEKRITAYDVWGATESFKIFSQRNFFAFGQALGRDLQEQKFASPAPLGPMPVLLSSKAGGTFVHEAIGHGLEADLILKDVSVFSNRLGKKIARDCISVFDDSTLPNSFGSYEFDDEGHAASKTVLIENGRLKNYLHSRQTAKKMVCKQTGNGRRESYRHPPIVRMSNTFIAPGPHDPENLLSAMKTGILVEQMGGGEVDTLTGQFVFEVNKAYRVHQGEKQERIHAATLAGNCLEVLNQDLQVGRDLGFGIGTCGKDGQNVPVSDGQPTILVPRLKVCGQ